MPKLTPCLWYDNNAGEAADFYCAIFPNSKINLTSYYGDGMPMPKGTVLTVEFELDGKPFTALNGGPMFPFTEAVSFQIECKDQAEVDRYWDALTADGGKPVQCGWLKDKFGLSWQVVPEGFVEMMESDNAAGKQRAMEAMMGMVKLDMAALQRAFDGS
jgi:predicted 3-demethylubiquinone-9 3-methyltransferase (glyoxalase superfamily)